MTPAFQRSPLAIGAVLLLAGCATTPNGDPTLLDQPMFGAARETTFHISPNSGEVKLRDVVAIAKVLRRYKTLDAAEKKLVELAARRHFDGVIALEVKRLERVYEPERRRVSAIADPAQRKREDEALSARIRMEAARNVADRLANLIAVPMKTASNHSVVAFARVGEGSVQVAGDAYELDAPINTVGPGTKINVPQDSALKSAGGTAVVANIPPVPLSR